MDLGVHSLKDVPSEIPDGLVLAAVPDREDPRDVLLVGPGHTLGASPRVADRDRQPAAPGAASRRPSGPGSREARGNVDTRIRRMREGRWDAIVLARAGPGAAGPARRGHRGLRGGPLLPAHRSGGAGARRAGGRRGRRCGRRGAGRRAGSQRGGGGKRSLPRRHSRPGAARRVAGRARATSGETLRLDGAPSFPGRRARSSEARGKDGAESAGHRAPLSPERLLAARRRACSSRRRARKRPRVLVVRSGAGRSSSARRAVRGPRSPWNGSATPSFRVSSGRRARGPGRTWRLHEPVDRGTSVRRRGRAPRA